MNASRAWTVEELLAEGARIAALFPAKSHAEITVRPHGYGGKVSVDIWPGNDSRNLKMVYGDTFEEAIAKAEDYAVEFAMSNRVMCADDLGLDAAA